MKSRRRLLATAILPVVAGLTLSGCSIAGTDFQPGLASVVGDRSITTNRVDALTADYCDAIAARLPNPVALSQLRSNVVTQLTAEAVARQIAADDAIAEDPSYRARLATLQKAIVGLPQDQQDAVLAVEGASEYVNFVLSQAGRLRLADQGTAVSQDAQQATTQISGAGTAVLRTWFEDHEVQIDPRYDVEVTDGTIAAVDENLSVATSSTALDAVQGTSDPKAVAALPQSQRCG